MFVDAVLHRWGRDGAIDRVALIASELVTNAVVHANTQVWLALEALDDVVRLEVGDGASRRPSVVDRSPTDPHGLGLPIVEALASSWGTAPAEPGKCVWAEVRC